jgi:iron(III) transport system substrate-binding protein
MTHRPRALALITVAALTLAACGSTTSTDTDAADSTNAATGDGEVVTIYSGRNENLVGPLLEQLEEETGVAVEVRYGDSAELAAQLLEEGERTEADLFFSQDAGALGALAGRDASRPSTTRSPVRSSTGYADEDGRWVATSARARVIAYNPEQAPEVAEMTSIDEILDPKYKGQVGIAPTNASFQSFVTALRVTRARTAHASGSPGSRTTSRRSTRRTASSSTPSTAARSPWA